MAGLIFSLAALAIVGVLMDLHHPIMPWRFQWYRRWRGGKWARVGGALYGTRWLRVSCRCVEQVDEDYCQ